MSEWKTSQTDEHEDDGPVWDLSEGLDEPIDAETLEAEAAESASLETDAIELPEDAIELVRQLESERDEAMAARTRALADYSNFQRRAEENEIRARTRGGAAVVQSLLPVLDNLELALSQEEAISLEQLIDGVKLVRDELLKTLEMHGVHMICPEPGEEFDPNWHEAMFKQPAKGAEPNEIVQLLQPGYAMGEQVLRPAKVAVASDD